jgi:hypothetical protein
MVENELEIDFFGDGMSIFLNYIARQYKKNKEYRPHPIIRAFECALEGLEKVKVGEKTIGLSSDGTEEVAYQPYAVVLEKQADEHIKVMEIRNLRVDKELPLDVMVIIFRLQIALDNIESDAVNPKQMVDALNHVIQGDHFYALGERWREARDIFKDKLEKGEIGLPQSFATNGIADELKAIKYDTPWVDYSNNLRAFIGSLIVEKFDNKEGKIIITSPADSKIEKYKVFDSATEFMIGKTSEFLKI